MFIFERERERERGRERGRHRIWSRLQALSWQYGAWCGAQTREPWDYELSWSWTLNWLSHPGSPITFLIVTGFCPLWILWCRTFYFHSWFAHIFIKILENLSFLLKNKILSFCFLSELIFRMPRWLSQLSIQLLVFAQVMIPGSWDRAPCQTLGWVWSLLGILSLPLRPPLIPPP